jgi:hypothetical protein
MQVRGAVGQTVAQDSEPQPYRCRERDSHLKWSAYPGTPASRYPRVLSKSSNCGLGTDYCRKFFKLLVANLKACRSPCAWVRSAALWKLEAVPWRSPECSRVAHPLGDGSMVQSLARYVLSLALFAEPGQPSPGWSATLSAPWPVS